MGYNFNPFHDVGQALHDLGGAAGGAPVDSGQTDDDRNRAIQAYNDMMMERAYSSTTAPTVQAGQAAASTIDQGQIGGLRARTNAGLDTLQAAANGQAPSVAAAQYTASQQDIAQQQAGLAAQARGTAGVAARRDAMTNIAQGQQRAALDTAMLRATEQATARGQLAGATDAARAQEQQLASNQAGLNTQVSTTNAGLNQRTSEANATNALTADQIGNAYKLGLGGQALQEEGLAQGSTGQKLTNEQANRGRQMQLFGAVSQGVGAGVAASDERVKEDIKPDSDKDVGAFLRSLEEVSYRYKDPAEGAGERHGILAQDLEKSRIGRSVVQTGSDGVKRVDTNALTLALAGVVAHMARKRRAR